MGVLADRLAHLARRYGSDSAAWQHEIHAVSALETASPKEALERFHAVKRRLAEFRRAQLLDELRRHPFALDVPTSDTRGYPLAEIEADIRTATRALTNARDIEDALREEAEARATLQRRSLPEAPPLPGARWDALGPLVEETETRRRAATHEARLERELAAIERGAAKLQHLSLPLPDASAEPAAIDDARARLAELAHTEDAYRRAVDPLKTPEVSSFRHASKRTLEDEARRLVMAEDIGGLEALAIRAEALRREAAALAAQAARSRRKGVAPPPRERRAGDMMDGYG